MTIIYDIAIPCTGRRAVSTFHDIKYLFVSVNCPAVASTVHLLCYHEIWRYLCPIHGIDAMEHIQCTMQTPHPGIRSCSRRHRWDAVTRHLRREQSSTSHRTWCPMRNGIRRTGYSLQNLSCMWATSFELTSRSSMHESFERGGGCVGPQGQTLHVWPSLPRGFMNITRHHLRPNPSVANALALSNIFFSLSYDLYSLIILSSILGTNKHGTSIAILWTTLLATTHALCYKRIDLTYFHWKYIDAITLDIHTLAFLNACLSQAV